MFKCKICEKEYSNIVNEGDLCVWCWFGMRIDPVMWKDAIKKDNDCLIKNDDAIHKVKQILE